tara:strand:+ start:2668 stop:3282 length:615 start_codon:yes stop_codon:yes gene_type:complete
MNSSGVSGVVGISGSGCNIFGIIGSRKSIIESITSEGLDDSVVVLVPLKKVVMFRTIVPNPPMIPPPPPPPLDADAAAAAAASAALDAVTVAVSFDVSVESSASVYDAVNVPSLEISRVPLLAVMLVESTVGRVPVKELLVAVVSVKVTVSESVLIETVTLIESVEVALIFAFASVNVIVRVSPAEYEFASSVSVELVAIYPVV